jgi:hypothetical protein
MTGRITHVSEDAVATGRLASDVRDTTVALNQAVEALRDTVIRSVRASIG